MARARVELRGSLTHSAPAKAGGRTLKRGSPVVLTNPSQIQYYRDQAGFSVTFLKDKAKAPAASEPAGDGGGEGEGDEVVLHTKAELNKMNKAELTAVMEALGLEGAEDLNNDEKRDAILAAQAELEDDE